MVILRMTKKEEWQRYLYHTNAYVACAIDCAKHNHISTEDAYLSALIMMTKNNS